MALTKQTGPQGRHRATLAAVQHNAIGDEMPVTSLPERGVGAEAAYEMISSDLLLDGQARLNLATFVTTWMPALAARLMAETADKNMIDKDEYPQTAEIESRCVRILADLWRSPDHEAATGCSTTGSSEAAMLAGLALKWRWRERMRAAGKATDKPNLVTGANVQICWEKFCRYWDVEPRLVPMEGDRYHLDAEQAVAQCDENTIGVVAVLGSTFDGSYEPVSDIAAALDKLEEDQGHRAASWHRSCSPTSSGTSGSHGCNRSTPRATSTASCIPASAGRSGAPRTRCPRTSCSTSTIWAVTCRRSH
jgi:glutamate decarboxylase